MKKLATLLVILFLFLFIACDTKNQDENTTPQTVAVSQFIRTNYTDDAKHLYFREIKANATHPNYTNAILDSLEVEKILVGIQAVYDLTMPQRDTIFAIENIHALQHYSLNSVSMRVDTQDLAIQNLANNQIPTGNSSLDTVLNTYNFNDIHLAYSYPQFNWIWMTTPQKYNLMPIINQLNTINPTISLAENNGGAFDGNDITMSRPINDLNMTLVFSKGWGDCPAGCIQRRYWSFAINNQTASYLGANQD